MSECNCASERVVPGLNTPARSRHLRTCPLQKSFLFYREIGLDAWVPVPENINDILNENNVDDGAAVRSAGYDWPLSKPEHRWVKSVPDSSGKFHSSYVFVDKGVRGAWPATYSWEAYGEEQYAAPALAAIN